jgi:hypothetical protein
VGLPQTVLLTLISVSWGLPGRAEAQDQVLERNSVPAAASNSPLESSRRPQVHVERLEQDVGVVSRGETAHFEFTIQNTGTAPLEIKVSPTCGCTLAHYDKKIAPGSVGKIEADLRTSSLSGKVQKGVVVTTNDPARSTLQLQLQATVLDVIQVDLSGGNTLYPQPGETLREKFRVQVYPAELLKITAVSSHAAYVRPSLRELAQPDPKTRAYEVELEVLPSAPFGRSPLAVLLVTDSPNYENHLVELACEKGIVAPKVVSFASARGGGNSPAAQTCVLKNKDGKINILSLECTDPAIEVTATAVREGTLQLLRVTWDLKNPAGNSPGFLRIKTDSPHQPLLEIPIAYSFEQERKLSGSSAENGRTGALASRADRPPSSSSSGRRAGAVSALEVSGVFGRTLYPKHGKELQQSVRVRVLPDEPLKINTATSDSAFAKVEITNDTADARAYDLQITLAPDTPFGRSTVAINLATDSPIRPQETVRVFVEKGITANPTSISFGTVRAGTKLPLTQRCLLKNRHGRINILSLKSSDPAVQVTAEPMLDGTHQLLTLTCAVGNPSGPQRGVLRIETDDSDQPVLEVTFAYTVSAPGGTAKLRP